MDYLSPMCKYKSGTNYDNTVSGNVIKNGASHIKTCVKVYCTECAGLWVKLFKFPSRFRMYSSSGNFALVNI